MTHNGGDWSNRGVTGRRPKTSEVIVESVFLVKTNRLGEDTGNQEGGEMLLRRTETMTVHGEAGALRLRAAHALRRALKRGDDRRLYRYHRAVMINRDGSWTKTDIVGKTVASVRQELVERGVSGEFIIVFHRQRVIIKDGKLHPWFLMTPRSQWWDDICGTKDNKLPPPRRDDASSRRT